MADMQQSTKQPNKPTSPRIARGVSLMGGDENAIFKTAAQGQVCQKRGA